jgi:L-cysteine desulfidase
VSIDVVASKNILKNAMSAGLPNTSKVGVNYAAGIGAMHGDPKNVLNVNNDVKESDYDVVEKMVNDGKIKVNISKEPNLLYIKVTVMGKSHEASCTIADAHTNVVEITVDDKVTFENKGNANNNPGKN